MAATQSCGLMSAMYESMVKRMQHGFASRNGLTAAALAASGYVGIKQVFERPYGGWLAVFGEGHRTYPEDIYKGLGVLWETERIAVKAYSCMGLLHAAIDSCPRAALRRSTSARSSGSTSTCPKLPTPMVGGRPSARCR